MKTRLLVAAGLLLGYWALTANVVAPDAQTLAIPEHLDAFGKVVFAAGYVTVCWLFLLFLYRKNVFLKA